ncbi:MAG: glycosyltransferase family 2 protein [Deltaproteobacteria bacterium]|nr:glycosyltransferase family 2 protein [Deltaproteobacteria bacterium]
MKLIIQIPCFNERETLPLAVAALPREIPGVSSIEILVIDDGSRDGTSEVARDAGVHHIVRFSQNRGLARAFNAGIDAALRLGADIIVNTDADNQYNADDIPALIRPILDGRADLVVGDRQVHTIAHFSPTKKRLQRLGSWLVRLASGTTVPDATSGFRAISREAALRMFVTSDFSYTLETIIQAGQAHLAVEGVPVRTNPKTRESRLFRSIPQYLRRSGATILRIYAMYKPLKAFAYLSSALFLAGAGLGLRFLYYHFTSPTNAGKVQSLILAAVLLIVAFIVFVAGMLADLIAANRKLLEDALMRLRRLELGAGIERPRLPTSEARSLGLQPTPDPSSRPAAEGEVPVRAPLPGPGAQK